MAEASKLFVWAIYTARSRCMCGSTGRGEHVILWAMKLQDGTKESEFLVDWTPQEDVLAHRSVGPYALLALICLQHQHPPNNMN